MMNWVTRLAGIAVEVGPFLGIGGPDAEGGTGFPANEVPLEGSDGLPIRGQFGDGHRVQARESSDEIACHRVNDAATAGVPDYRHQSASGGAESEPSHVPARRGPGQPLPEWNHQSHLPLP